MAHTGQDSPDQRAEQLVCSVLPDAMWLTFAQRGFIEFEGRRGVYIISPRTQTEVRDPKTGRRIAQACLQLTIPAPESDRMIVEYLLLKNAEDSYWKTANIFEHSCAGIAECFIAILDCVLLFHLLIDVV